MLIFVWLHPELPKGGTAERCVHVRSLCSVSVCACVVVFAFLQEFR